MLNGLTGGRSVTRTAEVEIAELLPDATDETERFALVIHFGESTDAVRLRPDAPIVIGRDFPSEVCVADPGISRQHARFLLRSGELTVQDLESKNGTLLNGVRIDSRATARPGDEIRIGSVRVGVTRTRETPVGVGDGISVVLRNTAMLELYALAERAARVDAPALILGETGSGKEHVARFIHARSPRSGGPFVPVNCAALPEHLAASLLFGHERGAFTGAHRSARGFFEEARGGVLFLDEIGELAPGTQALLLRALETKRILRVGVTREIDTDVRLVAATHCDLEEMVESGSFRADLFFRVNALTLEVPPLRRRRDEIESMVAAFVREASRAWSTLANAVEPAALTRLVDYDWPGNVRQLKHVVERAALAADGTTIREQDLPPLATPKKGNQNSADGTLADFRASIKRHKAEMIESALRRTGGNREAAARLLRIPIRTLSRHMADIAIKDDDFTT